MFTFIICLCALAVATDVAHSKYIDLPQLPDGIYLHGVMAIWSDAVNKCQSEGAILASPVSENIFNAMKSVISATRSTFFIGTKANKYPGDFVSTEGVPFENMTLTWQVLDPEDGDCLAMGVDHIRVVPCDIRLPYMCIKLDTANKTNTHDNKQKLNCGPREQGYSYDAPSKKCYKLQTDFLKWDEAQSRCVAEGGHLAVPENADEARTFKNMYNFKRQRIFVGLRHTGNGDWKSVVGQPVESLYNVWRSSRKPTDSDCLCGTFLMSGKLDDYFCSVEFSSICQKEPTV